MDDLYVESGYLEPGYLVYTARAQASLTCHTSVHGPEFYAEAGYMDPGYAEDPVPGSFSRIVTGSATLATTATISAVSSVTRDAGAATRVLTWDQQDLTWDDWFGIYWQPTSGIWLEPRFSIEPRGRATATTFIDLPCVSTISILGGLRESGVSTATAVFTTTAQPGFLKSATAAITAISSLRSSGGVTRSTAQSNITAQASIAVDAQIVPPKRDNPTLTASSSMTVLGGKVRDGLATLTAQATMLADAQATPPTRDNPTLLVQSAVAVSGSYLRLASAQLTATSNLTAAPRQPGLQLADATLSVTAQLTAGPVRKRNAVSLINAAAQTTARAVKTGVGVSNFAITTQQTAVPTRVRPGVCLTSGRFNSTCSSDRTRTTASVCQAMTTVNALGGFIASSQAGLISQFNIVPNGGILLGGVAFLNVQGFTLTVGDVIWWDPDLVLVVSPESRAYQVLEDIRTLSLTEETRVNTVLPEQRSLEVAEETRQLEVIA